MKKSAIRAITIRLVIVTLFGLICQYNLIAQDQTATLASGKKVILHADKTWEYIETSSYDYDFTKLADNQIPDFLRQGIKVNKETLRTAIEMYLEGWRYTMPRPKSSQASWGNRDGRTTWWKGYWYNNKTRKYSRSIPKKRSNSSYYGDEQNDQGYWRNGGSPSFPSKIEWLLSSSGGVRP